jgi:hypothetical protein
LSFFEFLSKKLSTAAAPLPRRLFQKLTAAAPHRDDNLEKFAAAAMDISVSK